MPAHSSLPGYLNMRPVIVEGTSPVLRAETADGPFSMRSILDGLGVERARHAGLWEDWLSSKDADHELPDGSIA